MSKIRLKAQKIANSENKKIKNSHKTTNIDSRDKTND